MNQPSNQSALVNLSSALAHLGRNEEADYYLGRVAYYRNHNPYYHYLLAKAVFEKNDFTGALRHLERAIDLKEDEHQFYHLLGLVQYKLQDYESSAKYFTLAKEVSEKEQQIAGYERKLQAVNTHLN